MRSRGGRRSRSRRRGQKAEGPNPYVGPRAFEEHESQYFFGRDEEIEILASLVMARRASLFFAQSGAGKSSLLRAGLIPELTRQETIGRGRRTRTYQKMWTFPILSVGGVVSSRMRRSVDNVYIFSALFSLFPNTDPNNLAWLTLADGLRPFFEPMQAETEKMGLEPTDTVPDDTPALLIFDQFEELFTQHLSHWSKREDFFRQVCEALDVCPTLHVLFSMREDYIAELTPYAHLLPDQLRPRFRLERLQRRPALQAVEQPAAQAGRFFDEGVAEALVDNLRRTQSGRKLPTRSPGTSPKQPTGGPKRKEKEGEGGETIYDTLRLGLKAETLGAYVEPVHLQIVLRQLWDNLPPNEVIILAKDVKDFGDVDQALTSFYEDTLAEVIKQTNISERFLRAWFDTQIITPARTRGLVYRGNEETEGVPNAAADLLNEAYIIRANIRGNDTWYELAHDRLVEPILSANQAWQVTYYNPVATAMKDWLDSGQDPRKLLRGIQLKEAKEFAKNNPQDILEEENAFLETSTRYLNPLALATQIWLDAARDPGDLLTGPQLEQARTYVEDNPENVSAEEKEFLAESIRRDETEQELIRQAAQRRRAVIISVIVVLLVLSGLTLLSLRSADNATREAANAARQKETAEMARAEAATLAAEAQANAAEAQQQRETAQAASTAAITEQEIALAERNSALEARGTAQAASTLAIQQQEMAEAERNSAVEARATLVAYLEQLLATEEPTPTPTATPLPTGTPVEFSIAADATATPTPTTIPTPTVDRGATATVLANAEAQLAEVKATQTAVALAETMVQVPAGTFLMGSLPDSSGLPGLDRNPEPEPDEFPQRAVFLPTFWIDRTEVTNADYRACVEAAVCARQSGGDPNYHNLPRFDKYPALFVSWQDAQTYCRWLGKRLPGEAEWEKAARGDDGRIWPWGNALQDNFAFPVQRANVGDSGIGSITETGNFPNGASPYGALDMSGNVWEWTNDWYKFTYYAERPDPDRSPPGPSEADSSGRKVIRGGSYLTVGIDSRTTERNAIAPDAAFDVGFRCAQD